MRKLLIGSAVAVAGLTTISCSDEVTGPLGPSLGSEEATVSHLNRQEAEFDRRDRPDVWGLDRWSGTFDDSRGDAHWLRPEEVAPDRSRDMDAWQARPELPVDGGPREGAVPVLRQAVVGADQDR